MYEMNFIPMELQSLLDREIDSDEQLEWSCQPSVWASAKKTIPAVIFGIGWLGIISWFLISIFQSKSTQIDELFFAGIFVLIGVFLVLTPLFAISKAKKTVYCVTDKRAIIIVGGSTAKIESYGPDRFTDKIKRIKPDGSGDLVFGRDVRYVRSRKKGTRRKVTEYGFFGIPDVNAVEDMLEAIAEKSTPSYGETK